VPLDCVVSSVLIVVSEPISGCGVEAIAWMVHVFAIVLGIWVLHCFVVGTHREQDSVPGSLLLLVSILLVSVALVVDLLGRLLGHIHAFLSHHCGEWLQVRSVVPGIPDLSSACREVGEEVASRDHGPVEPPTERLTRFLRWVHTWEVVDVPLVGHHWHTSLVEFGSSANEDG
jgi:hypothetical protein